MKTFGVWEAAAEAGGEYVLGVKDTGTSACYMIYGKLMPGQEGSLIKPGRGHEELLLCQGGELVVSGAFEGVLRAGEAFHVVGEAECFLRNPGDVEAVYVVAGGHSGDGH